MSKWMDMANEVKTRLDSLAKMAGIEVIVDRQKDISNAIAQGIARLSGSVQILFDRARPVGGSPLKMVSGYTLRLYTKPILRPEETNLPADELLEAMISALHEWHPDPRAHCDDEFKVTDGPELLPDKNFLIYEFQIECRVTLPQPTFNPTTP